MKQSTITATPRGASGPEGAGTRIDSNGGRSRLHLLLLIAGGLLLATGAGVLAFYVFRPIVVLPRIALSPGYQFRNQDGEIVTSEDARGRLTLYSLTYSACESDCAQSVEQIAAFQRAAADLIPADTPLAFVTVSIDPLGDATPQLQQLAAAAADVAPDLAFEWEFVSGDPVRTRQVVGQGFDAAYGHPVVETVDGQTRRSIAFEPRYVLVDGLGMIRAEYRTATPDPAVLGRDVDYLLAEARNSDGIARLGYEAAHLFACNPR